ncbi:MAG: hypothetical protein EAY75_04620 [Bacteroidetes bacterium]|nr:MAG: hypothetical protein EAY75_04620 [Bacteroidota bacterium]
MERGKNINAAIAQWGKHPVLKHTLWLILAAWVYTLTFIFNNYWSRYASYSSVTVSFQKALSAKQALFANVAGDSAALLPLLQQRQPQPAWLSQAQKPLDIFLYPANRPLAAPVFWSTGAVLPAPSHVDTLATGSFVRYGNGAYEFLKQRVIIGNKAFIIIGLIQLEESFFIENAKLRRFFPGFSGLNNKMALVDTATAYPLKAHTGGTLCFFQPLVPQPIYVVNVASTIVECLALFLVVVFVTRFSNAAFRQYKTPLWGLLAFTGCLLLLRFSLLQFGVPVKL